jgi:hypothetical protein
MDGATSRPVTPPLRALDTGSSLLTPEQVKRIEINRLKGRNPSPYGFTS